jgi:integrase
MNENQIRSLKWKKDRVVGLGDGLSIRIRKSSKTYIIRKTTAGRISVITLGKSPALSLKQAKFKAMQFAQQADVSSVIVSTLIEDYIKDVVSPSSKVPDQVCGYLSHIDSVFGRHKVISVTRFALVQFIKSYSAKNGARTADRLRGYLRSVFAYAVELGYRDQNPMDGVSVRVTGYIPKARRRFLSDDEIRMVWTWPESDPNTLMIKFLLLTGLRISEARAGYVDGDKYRIDDSKGKHQKDDPRPHWVHLTPTAKALLPLPSTADRRTQEWLKKKLVAAGITDCFVPHDCRRTFATIANSNGVEPFIVERALNHKMPGVMAIYNHAEYEAERIDCAEVVESAVLGILAS